MITGSQYGCRTGLGTANAEMKLKMMVFAAIKTKL